MCSPAAATAPPVPFGSGWTATLDPLGQPVLQPPLRVVDHHDLAGARLLRGRDGPQDQRAPAERVQDLGQRGTHARSLAGGDDDDRGRGHRSHRSIGDRSEPGHWGVVQQAGHWVLVPANQVRILAPQSASSPSERRCEHMFVPRYTEAGTARGRRRASTSLTEVLRHFGSAPGGRQSQAAAALARRVGHLDRALRRHAAAAAPRADPARGGARRRLDVQPRQAQATAVRQPASRTRVCELCGQGEEWRGRQMALILDHINGVADDNRLENLRIVCPNCAATLDTHCGGRTARPSRTRRALRCGGALPHRRRRASATARGHAACAGRGAGAPDPGRAAGGAAAVRASSSRRWRRRAGVRSGASTA